MHNASKPLLRKMRSQSPTWRLETPSNSATSWRVRPSAIHSRAESRWKMRRSPICRRRCSISWRCLALNTMLFIAHRPAAGVGHIRVLDRSSTKIIVGKTGTTRLYLASVIKVLASMPLELIEAGFESLAQDKSFSQKMRDKFKAVLRNDHDSDELFW